MVFDASSLTDFTRIYGRGMELNLRASKIMQSAWERAIREYQQLLETSVRSMGPQQTEGEKPLDPAAAQAAFLQAEQEAIAKASVNLQKIQQESMEELGALMKESLEMFTKLSPFANVSGSSQQD